ncbi:MAG TPA: GntG family PLP-dependent aldolase [Verrucomicrobiae bacterium]|jgi:threonine aldolase|nr:GntG family PLP-dependent aldolase [Verrucomicrobiae bacterium]
MSVLDLRSDTVTHPTAEMRRAMAAAELGDDVWREDPTVNALEARAAELLGKEAGLFVSSGTMGNLVSLMAHVPRGGEIIAGAQSHIVRDEAAGHAVVVGASVLQLRDRPDGTLDPDEVAAAFRDPTDAHEPITSLVTIENAHSHSGNQPVSVAATERVAAVAHERGVPLHVDGARFFNAVVALGVGPAELAAPADSVSFCLSKGLSCPAGSVVVGSSSFIGRARRARKLLGGGMRQAGVLAAAGLVALRDGDAGMIARLAEDHANARRLAERLAAIPGVRSPGDIAQPGPDDAPLDPSRVRTNFVLFRVAADRAAFLAAAEARGVRLDYYPHGQVRAVTNSGIAAADIDRVADVVEAALADVGPAGAPRSIETGVGITS